MMNNFYYNYETGEAMMRIIYLLFILGIVNILLAGCGKADMEGIVLDINEHEIKLAKNLTPEEYDEIKDMSVTILHNEDVAGDRDLGLIDLTYEHHDELNKGDEVEVWIDGDMMDSYPPQAAAKKVQRKD